MSSLMADLASAGAATAPGAASDANPSLFMALLQDELQTVAAALAGTTGQPAGTTAGSPADTLAAATEAPGAPAAATASAATTSASTPAATSPAAAPVATPPAGTSTTGAATGTTSAGSSTPAPSTAPSKPEHEYVVLYVHGQTPVSIGPTPAPLVRGPTGKLVLTAKTTGLTQLTPRFTGTVADPTAAAQATATVMATIARLKASGQA